MWEFGDARPEQVLDVVRDRKVVADRRQSVDDEGASDLEREERVSERRLEHPAQDVPGQAEPDPVRKDAARRAEAQVADVDAFQRSPLERALEHGHRAGAPSKEERDRLPVEAAGNEGERVGGRAIDPLEVVDGHEQGLARGERAQRVHQRDRDRVRLGRGAGRFRAEERDLESVTLGRW